jgi:hypothetical protein
MGVRGPSLASVARRLFHGKEGVASSSLALGFPRYAGDISQLAPRYAEAATARA